ncbi:MAG: hypothetical protein ACLQJ0_22900 [Steroidobacteraceae bacterium]|jgi:hypothetical protein
MTFAWPDPISLVADIISIFGIPVLVASTISLYREARNARRPESVSHGCLEFYDVDGRCGINLIPLKEIAAIPRSGDQVLLPGEYVDLKNYGGGEYEVLSVEFSFTPAPDEVDQPCPALPAKIVANVRKLSR